MAGVGVKGANMLGDCLVGNRVVVVAIAGVEGAGVAVVGAEVGEMLVAGVE